MGAVILAATMTILGMLVLRPVAIVTGLVDRPGGRKMHQGDVPVIGGMAMYLGAAFGLTALQEPLGPDAYFLLGGVLLLGVGVIDDRFYLSPWIRLVAHICAGLLMTEAAGLQLASLGSVFGEQSFELGRWSLLVTLVATAAAVNAYNMMDGMDGLAGGMACVALGSLAAVSLLMGNPESAGTLAVLVAAIAGFLVFNLPLGFNQPVRVFMGDAGSTFLGFAVAWFGIKLTQGEGAVIPPVTVLWITAVPLMELAASFTRRIVQGKSPFSADAEHFHHVLRGCGLTVRATFSVLFGLQLVFSGIGIGLTLGGAPDYVSLSALLVCVLLSAIALFNSPAIAEILRGRNEARQPTDSAAALEVDG